VGRWAKVPLRASKHAGGSASNEVRQGEEKPPHTPVGRLYRAGDFRGAVPLKVVGFLASRPDYWLSGQIDTILFAKLLGVGVAAFVST